MLLIYCRVSSLEQERGETIDGQLKRGVEFAKTQHLPYRVIAATGHESASVDDMEDRPSLRQLLEEVKSGGVDSVWVRELSRLSRNDTTKAEIFRVLRKHKVKIYSDGIVYDLESPSSELQADVGYIFAKYEAKLITSRMAGGREDLRAKGGMAHRWLFGYKQGPRIEGRGRRTLSTWVRVPSELAVIRKMYDWLFAGMSLNGIMRRLLDEGLMTQQQLDKKGTKIRRLFSRIEYAGLTWADHKGGRMVPSKHYTEKVITIEEWKRAQAIVENHKTETRTRFSGHICSGLISCASCKQKYHYYETSVASRGTVRKKKRYHYYKHQEAPWREKCKVLPKNLNVDYVHALAECVYIYSMMSRVDVALISEQVQAALNTRQGEIKEAIERLTEQEADIEKEASNIKRAIAKGIDVDEFAEELKALTSRRTEVRQLISARKSDLINSSDDLATLVARTSIDRITGWYKASPAEKRKLLQEIMIGRVHDGKIIISTKTNRHFIFPAHPIELPTEFKKALDSARLIAENGSANGTNLPLDPGIEHEIELRYMAPSWAKDRSPMQVAFAIAGIEPKFFNLTGLTAKDKIGILAKLFANAEKIGHALTEPDKAE